jgi:hypothetical protein
MAQNKTFTNIGFWALIGLAAVTLVACTAGATHFKRSANVADTFENFHVLNDYRYYFSGNEYKPTAVIGLQRDYTLTSSDWHPVALDEKMLGVWMERMMMQPGAEYNVDPNGAYILDDRGSQIGVWYAVWDLPILKHVSEKEIVISNPVTVFPFNNRGDDDGDHIRPD